MIALYQNTFSQSATQNYIKVRTVTNEQATTYLDEIQYFDGLGRQNQTVQAGITANHNDLATLQEYDNCGRKAKEWLPVIVLGSNGAFVPNFSSKASTTYNNTTYNSNSDSEPWSYPVYESSPLNRILQQFGAGVNWHSAGKSVKTEFLAYNSNNPCAYYYVSGDNLMKNGNYINGSLFLTKITDEDGNISFEFKDKLDKIVLQRQINNGVNNDTYYVYDDFGNLRYVLPPMASDALTGNSYSSENTIIKNYAYFYQYNSRNLVKAKRLPGCEPVFYVYDCADRLIFSQDGEQRKQGKWLFTIPDKIGRTILTGTCTNSLNYNSIISSPVYAIISTNSTYKGYTVNGVSPANPVILSVNYYDSYNFRGFIPQTMFKPDTDADFNKYYSTSASSLLTGTLNAVIDGASNPSQYLWTVIFYDYRGQIIQTVSNNQASGINEEYVAYNFIGQPVKKKIACSVPANYYEAEEEETEEDEDGEVEDVALIRSYENYRYEYDHAGRLLKVWHKLNGKTEVLMSENSYDELGRLKTNTPFNLPKFKTEYAYNVRSWTTSISNSKPFWEYIGYTFGGNIEATQWNYNGIQRAYSFDYDNLSRLVNAHASIPAANDYSVSYQYDKHGNITHITRGTLDNLTLNYNAGNQLYNISDAVDNSPLNSVYEFKNYSTSSGAEYTWNTVGAMTKDLNKGISEIAYNVLNLPLRVDIKNPVAEARNEYTYSADGHKLKTVTRWNSHYSTNPVVGTAVASGNLNSSSTTEYIGNYTFENKVLKRISTENGYYDGNNYYFYVRNHLGSNVMVADKNGNIVQATHYFPFGLSMSESTGQGIQSYKFTGKELDMEHGLNLYDFEARTYDPAVGRFTSVDPLAEKYYSISPYAYCADNPLRFIDLHGDSISVAEGHRDQFNSSLNSVFGNYSQNFGYTSTGMLTYNGSTKGMTGDQKAALKGMTKVMNESTITNVVYGENTQITDNNGNTSTINASVAGGAVTVLASENPTLSQNTILISPSMPAQMTVMEVTSAYYMQPINPANGARFRETTVQTNFADVTFHELGHVIYQGQSQDKVIDFNNRVRKILNLPKRPYDETHNRTVRQTNYE
ncbi:MAG: RHS repeat-associated core domain-containing protein [Dysgonamonadaceae bacterium]|nr:RHS repeat-associated core domain-containing protein [Dysgonamonadaceae bacterium]